MIREVDPLGVETTRRFDANDLLVEESCEGICKKWRYNLSNRPISQEEKHPDGFQSHVACTYDYMGNQLSEVDRFGNVKHYQYDAFHRVVECIYPPVGGFQSKETYGYDVLNNRTLFVDANGAKTKTAYTIHGNPCQIDHPDGTRERFRYDLNGTLTEHTDQLGVVTRYRYDYKKRKIREEKISPDGKLLCTAKWTYNAFHLLEEKDYEGNVTSYRYDGAGRLIEEKKGKAATYISYDSLGRAAIKREEISPGIYRASISVYDVLDRPVEEKVEDHDGTLKKKISYTYDSRGNRTSVSVHTDHGMSSTMTEYNTRNQPVKLTTPDGVSTHYVYRDFSSDMLGQEVECVDKIDPLGVVKRILMDPLGHPISEEILSPVGEILHATAYSYDGVGNMVHRKDDIFTEGALLRTVACQFTYDAMGRGGKRKFLKPMAHLTRE